MLLGYLYISLRSCINLTYYFIFFKGISTEANRHILYDIVKTGLAAKRMKDINVAYGVGWIIDESIVDGCPRKFWGLNDTM